ncbi:MAG TPA: ABC transporter permease subunit [Candidatus Baltobacteraceae bacterium]|nr:ABC transporter permease subunit [Candidatus Baltobacteraceae bacterium]
MWQTLFPDTLRHAELALSALVLACSIGAPFGLLAASRGWARSPILAAAALGRTLPSIAVLALLVPLLGVGAPPAIAALTLLALPPIVFNVDLAVRSAPAAALDVATGLGMTARQRFVRVVVPFALPTALAGVRTASIEVIGSAALATFVGAGGLGDDIVRGLQTADSALLIAASILVAALAFLAGIRS